MSEDLEFLKNTDFDEIEKANKERMEAQDAEAVTEEDSECESCKI
ncbi:MULTISPECIES: hypothetical protein [Oligella]|uniref:Uncharacterized protein n=1 Tax=Oligella urethralis TaxID=90245 RepID=A0A2X1ULN1_9BURK|nr:MULTISPECIES: hypothetical protein [Oligella]SPY08007.1 Uncharacterised protein [Oligella urethralis]